MPRYTHRPTEVDAFQVNVHPRPGWFIAFAAESGKVILFPEYFRIRTCYGSVQMARTGDWIVKSEEEVFVMGHDLFLATYEPLDAPKQLELQTLTDSQY